MIDGGGSCISKESISRLQKCIKTERSTIDRLFKDVLFWYNDDDEDKWKLVGKKRKQIFKLKFKLLKLYDKIFEQLILLMEEDI